jgi:hypothetical protein
LEGGLGGMLFIVCRKGKKAGREMEKEIEKRFEYVIKVNGKDVWHGLNPEEKFDYITTSKYVEIKGVVPGARLIAYIHELRIKLRDDANFLNGEKIKLRWEG